MGPIDSAGVGLDPNELGFARPYFFKVEHVWKFMERNIVAGLVTSHESKSFDQKNV